MLHYLTVALERVRGFRDIYPEDSEPRKRIFEVSEKAAEVFGFRKIEMPSVEHMDLYRIKSGDELVSQCFSFLDKGGRQITLTPEATPTVVRMLTSRKDISRPVRWYSFQKYWRYEEPQAGRQREFYQFNGDIFGPSSANVDAEVIGLASFILNGLGLKGNYRILINDRYLMERILKENGIKDDTKAFSIIDKFKRTDRDQFLLDLEELGMSKDRVDDFCKMLEGLTPIEQSEGVIQNAIHDGDNDPHVQRFISLTKILPAYSSDTFFLDLSIVRGLAYYTGVVFEAFDVEGKFRSILGGGRYDNLAELYSGQKIPAVGFGMGDSILELLMKHKGLFDYSKKKQKFYVATPDSAYYSPAVILATEIRSNGIPAHLNLNERNMGMQIKEANKEEVTDLIILGKQELETGSLTWKKLDSGRQISITYDSFLDILTNRGSGEVNFPDL
jgi:histidyl-tRNA synthetase